MKFVSNKCFNWFLKHGARDFEWFLNHEHVILNRFNLTFLAGARQSGKKPRGCGGFPDYARVEIITFSK